MIHEYPYLFKVVTLICIESLRSLLVSHPNCPFVESILSGFKDRFWPAAKADLLVSQKRGYDNCCRWDNSLLWDLPTESSFRGQSVSPLPYHILHIILHIKFR